MNFGGAITTPLIQTVAQGNIGVQNLPTSTPAASKTTSEVTKEISDITSVEEELTEAERFPGTITYNCPQGMAKYYRREKPYPKKDGTIRAYYICCRSQATSKCTGSIHLVFNEVTRKTNTIIRRAHLPQCEQLILRPEVNTVVKDAKKEMSSLAKDMATNSTLSNREIANEVIKQTEAKYKGISSNINTLKLKFFDVRIWSYSRASD
jgi:hypothetical protein